MSALSSQERHSQVWEGIFEDETWTSTASDLGLNPVLLGEGLHSIYNGTNNECAAPAEIALITGDISGDIRFHRKTLFESLRRHTFREATNEVFFEDANIILNIHDALEAPEMISIDPEKLISGKENKLRSAYLFWRDSSYSLRTTGPEDIISSRGNASALKDVSVYCSLSLVPPEDSGLVRRIRCFVSKA